MAQGLQDDGTRGTLRTDSARGTSHGSAKPRANLFPKTYDEAVNALGERGIVDAGTQQSRFVLERVGYHHLQPYLRCAERAGFPTMRSAHDLWVFDRRFQAILFEYIGVFETQFKSQYAYHMNKLHGAYSLYDASLFHDAGRHAETLRRIEGESSKRQRREGEGVGGREPVWSALDAASLGTVSKLYGNTRDSSVSAGVAGSFGVSKVKFRSWVSAISAARNRCAHFDCFAFKKQVTFPPKRLEGVDCPNTVPLYVVLLIERLLSNPVPFSDLRLHYSIELATRTRIEVSELLAAYPGAASQMGLPDDWRELLFAEEVLGRR